MVEDAITAAGHHLVFRPKYSPDFGFVELAFAHIKRYLREYRYCITEASLPMWIDNAILSLPDMTPHMRHCGY